MDKQAADVARTTFIATLVVALSVAAIAMVAQSLFIFLLTFAAILLAIFLRAISDPLARRTGLKPLWSLTLVIIALTAVTAITIALLAPAVAGQFDQLSEQLPQAMQTLAERMTRHQWLRRILEELPTRGELTSAPGLLARLTSFVSITAVWLASALILLMLGLYLAAQPALYFNGILQLFPPARRQRMREVGQLLGQALRTWLLFRIIVMLVVAVLTALGLMLLDMPLALTLGLIAGILDFIPNIGPIIAALPAALIGFAQDPLTGVYVVGVYLFVQTLEGYVLTPIVLQRTSDIPAAVTLLAQIVLGALFGIVGLFLAAPLAIVGAVLVKELYVRDALGNDRQ